MSEQPFIFERKVAFGDTDLAGVAHFSRLLDYVEEAAHALFSQLRIPVIGSGSLWPKVRIEVDFKAPARFGETLQVSLQLARLGHSSLTFDFRLEHQGQLLGQGQFLGQGQWIICHSQQADDGTIRPEPIPEIWAAPLRDRFPQAKTTK